MVTPASNIDIGTISSVAWKGFREWDGTEIPPVSDGVRIQYQTNIRPASGTSPIRADGSRAPRAWDHRFGQVVSPRRALEFRYRVSSDRWERWSTQMNQSPVHLDRAKILTAVGARWIDRTDTSFPYDVEAQARTKALLKVQQSRASLGVTLAEMHKTVSFVADAGLGILRTVDGLTRVLRSQRRMVVDVILGRPVQKPKALSSSSWDRRQRDVLKRWLEYQFAVKPLYSDIKSSGEALSDLINNQRKAARLSVRAGSTAVEEKTYTNPDGNAIAANSVDQTFRLKCTSECHISCIYEVPISATRTFNELGLGNPLSVAWELTQFSWMVDYLLGVGPWLDSLLAVRGTSFVEGSMSRKMVVTFPGAVTFRSRQSARELNRGYGPANIAGQFGRFNRVVLTDLWPSYRPYIRNRMNLVRMANVLAVLPGLLSRSR